MSRPNKTVWFTLQKEGIHRFPQALTDSRLESVRFLGFDHRHIFHIKVWLEVTHDDRDIEFIIAKRDLEAQLDKKLLSLDHKSCEMICNDIAAYLKSRWPKVQVNRWIAVDVSEDGENGAHCEYP